MCAEHVTEDIYLDSNCSRVFKKTVVELERWSVVKFMYCCCRGSGFGSQHPYDSCHPPVTSVQGTEQVLCNTRIHKIQRN